MGEHRRQPDLAFSLASFLPWRFQLPGSGSTDQSRRPPMSATPSLIETVRVRRGSAPLWPLHLRRLEASCRALGVPFPTDMVEPQGGADRAYRLEVGAKGASATERAVGHASPVRLVTGRLVHRSYPHKTTDRDLFSAALDEARAVGADDALLLTAKREVAEAAIWCVFWWEGDRLCAPALELGVLPGVSRRRIEELAGPAAERRLPRAALSGLPLFVSNAVRGIVEVAELDGTAVPRHAGTEFLQRRFWA